MIQRGEGYPKTPENTLMYLFYFFPKTFTSNYFVIKQVEDRIKELLWKNEGSLEMYDVSAGTGAATAAFLYLLKEIERTKNTKDGKNSVKEINLTLQDISDFSLDIAKKVVSELSREIPHRINITKKILDSARLSFDKNMDIVICSFALYEIFGNSEEDMIIWCRKILKSLKEDGMFILVEPAVKSRNSIFIMRIRDSLKEHVVSPCPHNLGCPILKIKNDWCHFGLKWNPPFYLTRGLNMIGGRTPDVNFSFLIMTKGKTHKSRGFARVVSHRLEEKGKIQFWACENGEKIKYYVLKKNLSEGNSDVKRLQIGDLISVEDAHERSSREREIKSESRLKIEKKMFKMDEIEKRTLDHSE